MVSKKLARLILDWTATMNPPGRIELTSVNRLISPLILAIVGEGSGISKAAGVASEAEWKTPTM
jgi:hypothetical protein